jgi:hypothetical protein
VEKLGKNKKEHSKKHDEEITVTILTDKKRSSSWLLGPPVVTPVEIICI